MVAKKSFTSLSEGKAVVVLEAAILLRAGWEELCHEVWGCVIPVKEVGLIISIQRWRQMKLKCESSVKDKIYCRSESRGMRGILSEKFTIRMKMEG